MSIPRPIVLFFVFLLSMPMLACGEKGGAAGTDVALFINGDVVDYYDPDPDPDPLPPPARASIPEIAAGSGSDGTGSEASNMEAGLRELGANVTTFTDLDAESIELLLEDQAVLVLPENEGEDAYMDAFDADVREEIFVFVENGGTLIMAVDSEGGGVDLLNDIFSWSIDQNDAPAPLTALADGPSAGVGAPSFDYSIDFVEAISTSFEGGPEVLTSNDGDYPVRTASLPGEALSVYTYEEFTGVAVIPTYDGTVVILSYDWYDAAPVGSQDGGWSNVLGASLKIEEATAEE